MIKSKSSNIQTLPDSTRTFPKPTIYIQKELKQCCMCGSTTSLVGVETFIHYNGDVSYWCYCADHKDLFEEELKILLEEDKTSVSGRFFGIRTIKVK